VSASPVTVEYLISAAEKQAGLSDFGDRWFLYPLGKLIEFATSEGGLTREDPRATMLVGFLADRLHLIELLRRHPEIHEEKIDVAGVIIGQARGGSTLMQRILAQSPQLNTLMFWEVNQPLPLPAEGRYGSAERVAKSLALVQHMLDTWPEMRSWHQMDALQPEEEIYLLDRAFMSTMYLGYFFMPSYNRWLLKQDHRAAYSELLLWLKVLQWQKPERRARKWLLKSPSHFLSGALNAVLTTFPDATIIMTHRRMDEGIPSVCSIAANSTEGSGGTANRAVLGKFYIEIYRAAFDVMMDVRRKNPGREFLDLAYNDIGADTPAASRRTMRAMGLQVTTEDEEAAQQWMSRNGRDTHPRHAYRVEDFGTSKAELNEIFADYHRAFLNDATRS
jgi:hypothetical protein